MFIFGLCSQVFIYGGIGFLSPTFTLHMTTNYQGFDEFWIGIYFAMPAVSYIINSVIFVPKYCARYGRRKVLLVGSFLFAIAIMMIGTSPALGFPDTHHTIFLGTLLLGFAACMVTVPIMPEMISSIEQ
jgi:MFS family permease